MLCESGPRGSLKGTSDRFERGLPEIGHVSVSDTCAVKTCIAECVGKYLLVSLGCGVVHSAVLTGSQSGLWQVAIVWGLAIMLAIYVAGPISGAHINPAITLAFAARGRFPWRIVPPYLASPLAGAFAAAATLFAVFTPWLAAKEAEKGVCRGQPGSEATAMCSGEYFLSLEPLATASGPYSFEEAQRLSALVGKPVAILAEMLRTMILSVVVFALTAPHNSGSPGRLAPVFIGLGVAAMVSVIAPWTQACFNPARDFGPRLFALLADWGRGALPGTTPTGFLSVYTMAPISGALLGAFLYDTLLRPRTLIGDPCRAESKTFLFP